MRNYSFFGILFLCLAIFNVNLTAKDTFPSAKVENFNIFHPIWSSFSNSKIEKVVIDAGHGGIDGGTSGSQSTEKDITLNIALGLGQAISDQFPEIEIIYTRETDVFVSLKKRVKIANDAHADLFISVHCNAMPSGVAGRKIHGSETYVLGVAKKERNLLIAKRENEALFLDHSHEGYSFTDADSPEWHIFMSMYQQTYLERSIQFAEKVEAKMANYTKRKSRGVLQANFHVLREVAMPSVLIETGYLSNFSDQKYLSSKIGQEQVIQSIADAFYEYKMSIETDSPVFYNSSPAQMALAEKEIPKPVIKRKVNHTPSKKTIVQGTQPKTTTIVANTPAAPTKKGESVTSASSPREIVSGYETIQPVTKIEGPKIVSVSEGDRHEVVEEVEETVTPPVVFVARKKPKRKIVDLSKLQIEPVFKIQIAAAKQPINVKTKKYKQLSNIETVYENGYFKYLTGHSKYWTDITSLFKVLRNKGYEGFIVAYLNGQRIGLQEARDMARKP